MNIESTKGEVFILKTLATINAVILSVSFSQSESHAAASTTNKTLTLAATEWCPFICDDINNKGFVTDYLTVLLGQHEIDLKVDVLPWSRAIMLATNGSYDGLLTATEKEAPMLLFPTVPTGTYQMCFFSATLESFTYDGRDSLAGKRIGVIKDYSYGEPLDSILVAPRPDEHFIALASTSPLYQLVAMSKMNRIDLLVEDKMVMSRFTTSEKASHIKLLDCFDALPFHTAISPKSKHAKQWVEILDKALSSEQAPIIYEQMKKNYK